MALFKWDVWSPEDDPDPRWFELQKKEGTPSTWKLFAQMNEAGVVTFVGKIEKPVEEDRYYLGHAPPSAKELAAEKLAMNNGLGLCHQNTLQFRADHTPCQSFDSLGKAQRALIRLVREEEPILLERAKERLRQVLRAMDALEDDLVQRKLDSLV